MPALTERVRPKGLPTAMATSPMRTLSLSAKVMACTFAPSIFSTAMSDAASPPIFFALYSCLSLPSVTTMSSAPSMTWLFVRMCPSVLTITPEPSPMACLRLRSVSPLPRFGASPSSPSGMPKKRRNVGSLKYGFCPRRTFFVEEIVTTHGATFSTTGA